MKNKEFLLFWIVRPFFAHLFCFSDHFHCSLQKTGLMTLGSPTYIFPIRAPSTSRPFITIPFEIHIQTHSRELVFYNTRHLKKNNHMLFSNTEFCFQAFFDR